MEEKVNKFWTSILHDDLLENCALTDVPCLQTNQNIYII